MILQSKGNSCSLSLEHPAFLLEVLLIIIGGVLWYEVVILKLNFNIEQIFFFETGNLCHK